MKGVILAAGKGTRMLPLTERRPKPLVPVLDRPMLEHIITGARDAGVDEIGIIIGHLGDTIVDHFGDGGSLGVRLDYIIQDEAKGTGHAALLAEEFVAGEAFFMSWGDIIVPPENYANVVNAFGQGDCDAVLSLNYVDDPYQGAAVYEEDGFVVKIHEKPPQGTATTNWNNAGLFVYKADLFDRLRNLKPSSRGELELPDAVQEMIREGERIRAVKLVGYWSDVARPAAVLALNKTIMEYKYREQYGIHVDAAADLNDGCVVKPPVYVGPGCVIEDARIGPNVSLASNCHVERNAQLRNSALFDGAHVGNGAIVTACVVEEGAHIPAGENIQGAKAAPLVIRSDGAVQEVPE